jgi:hypothetical protein
MSSTTALPDTQCTTTFSIQTRIGRAAGDDGRYSCGAVRALPAADPEQVVLEATDGKQAVCLVIPGTMSERRLVPTGVLPTRQLNRPATIALLGLQWQSSEGKLAHDQYGPDASFPPVADVLPEVHPTPYAETPAEVQDRIERSGLRSTHVVLGIDVDLLRKIAEGLGTSKLTLMIPVPIVPEAKRGEACVRQPVLACPCGDDGGQRGIGVIMPINPGNSLPYYSEVRQIVRDSESQARARDRRAAG